jgi:hypothetical protein
MVAKITKSFVLKDLIVFDEGKKFVIDKLEISESGELVGILKKEKHEGPVPKTVNRMEISVEVREENVAQKTHKFVGHNDANFEKAEVFPDNHHYGISSISNYMVVMPEKKK